MGIYYDDAEVESRLNSSTNVLHKTMGAVGRPNEATGHSRETHIAAGVLASFMTQKEAAAIVGVTQPIVSYASRGKSHSSGIPDESLAKEIEDRVSKIQDKVTSKILGAVDKVDTDLLGDDPIKAAKVASLLSNIMEKTLPKEQAGNHIQVIVYAPKENSLNDYETVEIAAQVVK